jgi:hypothetical protein
MENIYRNLEAKDRSYIETDIGPKKRASAREKFQLELIKNEQEAVKKGLPFARHAAVDDFEQEIKSQVDKQLREHGSIERPDLIKLPKMDWKSYSDLKNFKIESEKERPDNNLSNKNPGLNVMIKTVDYRFKDYGNRYIVMEDAPGAITRSLKNKAKLDKEIAKEIS